MFSLFNMRFAEFFNDLSTRVNQAGALLQRAAIQGQEISNVLYGATFEDGGAAVQLMTDYSQHIMAANRGAMHHHLEVSDDDLNARALFNKQKKEGLNAKEQATYQELLTKLYAKEVEEQNQLYAGAEKLLGVLHEAGNVKGLTDRQLVETRVIQAYLAINNKSKENLKLEDYTLVEMVTSRILLENCDEKATKKETVTYLAAVCKELNRIRKKDEVYSGEDFVAVKVRQLDFLYKGLKNYDWQFCFVDDEPNNGQRRTRDVIEDMKKNDTRIQPVANKISTLDYDEDMKEEIEAYEDEKIKKMNGVEFAKASYKGGGIETGLRYVAQVTPGKSYKTKPSDVIIYTDCDTSINLAGTGILVNLIETGSEVAIGSRRIEGAHVIGKTAERHMQSFFFNLLVRSLLNLQVTDTQVGAKAFRKNVIKNTHHKYGELSMAFDPEVLRLAAQDGAKIGEQGMVWVDSEIESKSADQSQNMFSGLMRIAERFYPTVSVEEMTEEGDPQKRFENLADKLSKEGTSFDALLQLALDPKWHVISKFSGDLYNLILPKEWRNFINSGKLLIQKIAMGTVSEDQLMAFGQTLLTLVNDTRESYIFSFILKEFPQVFDVIDLLHRDRNYIYVIAPLLFGDNVYTKLLSKQGYRDLSDFKANTPAQKIDESNRDVYERWKKDGKSPKVENVQAPARKALEPNMERINKGSAKLSEIEQPINIGLVMLYDSDKTNEGYINRALIAKMDALKATFGNNKNITWTIYVVDARPENERQSGIEKVFDQLIQKASNETVKAVQISLPGIKTRTPGVESKPLAVRYGMDRAADDGCEMVGYVDFSDKIDIREMGNLVSMAQAQTMKNDGHACVIGSRRHEEAEVENKPLTFLLRSMGLNMLVKGLFPRLFHLSDTQTGFKIMSAKTWKAVKALGLSNNTMAFDIELLQQASRAGAQIEEHPVDFYDNSMIFDQEFDQEKSGNMFGELIKIRGAISDNPAKPPIGNEAALIGGGAENAVYKLADGSLLKIPHEAVDPHFLGILKHFILKNQKEMTVADQREKLVTTGFISQILSSPRFSQYIPALRGWADFNLLIMKIITSIENKNYKSVGYETAEKFGKDLVIPFRFVREPFTLKIDGVDHVFTQSDDVKQTIFAEEVFKSRFNKILNDSNLELNPKVEALKNQINDGIGLFQRLWARGLFDIDANFMCDTGYYDGKLMSLDPGELIDDCSQLDVEGARAQIEKRYDFIEMEIYLRALPEAQKNEILKYYKDQMNQFFDYIKKDLTLPLESRDFGKERREKPTESFAIVMPMDRMSPLTKAESGLTESQRQRQALHLSAVGYQLPYTGNAEWPLVHEYQSDAPFYHLVPEGTPPHVDKPESETVLETRMGSIIPALEVLDQNQELRGTHEKPALVILDAGTATRSALLKYAQPETTKGNIVFDQQRLYQRAVAPLQTLSNDLGPEYIIITSSDDILFMNDQTISQIKNYFNAPNSPGAFWFDLPHGGSDIAPMTVADSMAYMQSPKMLDMAVAIARNTPVTKGIQMTGVIDQGFNAFKNLMKLSSAQDQSSSSSSSTSSQGVSLPPGMGALAEFYTQFLQYQALMETGGMKKPFTMIFKRDFLKDFYDLVKQKELLPDYVLTDITWENILLRGMKSDLTIWKISNKPSGLDNTRWEQLWHEIQTLKKKYNIDTESPAQNQAREINFEWFNFDDPMALFTYTKHRAESLGEGYSIETNSTTVSFDTPAQSSIDVQGSIPGQLACVNCNIQGTIVIAPQSEGAYLKKLKHHDTLMYNLTLPQGKTLYPIPNHVVSQIGDKIYSVDMRPNTKDKLKQQIVYVYNDQGKPEPFMKFSEFMKHPPAPGKQKKQSY